MKASELAELLDNCGRDSEVFVRTEDGLLHDFKAEERPETFDGFDTVFEAGFDLVMID